MKSQDRLDAQRRLEARLAKAVADGWHWERISYEDEENVPFKVHLRGRLDLRADKDQML